jgi:hypothetical protein
MFQRVASIMCVILRVNIVLAVNDTLLSLSSVNDLSSHVKYNTVAVESIFYDQM